MKTCVYTYLVGSYDPLLPQPVAADSGADFICLTDDPTLRSDTWDVVVVEPRFPADSVRSARYLKIVGHDRLDEYDATLAIDASVRLRRTPEDILGAWLRDDDVFALAAHSYREQILDEFDEVVRLNYDDRDRVHEQLIAYSLTHSDVLASKPLWTGMLARRRTDDVSSAMRLWYDHVLRYSRRDQLSLPIVLAQTGLPFRTLELDNFESEFHQWPVIEGRRIAQGKAKPHSSGPLVAELRRARKEQARLREELEEAGVETVQELSHTMEDLRGQLGRAAAERARLEGSFHEALRDAGRWQAHWEDTQGITGAWANFARSVKTAFTRR